MPIYVITVAKGGLKMKLSADQTPIRPPVPGDPPPPFPQRGAPVSRGGIMRRLSTLEGNAVTVTKIIQNVFSQLDRIVVDKPGLTGLYDINVQWNPAVGWRIRQALPSFQLRKNNWG
jgi:uncharacterized protein (TIGR03435 family)